MLAVHLNGEAPPIIESLLDPFRYCEVCGDHPVTFLHRLRPNGLDIWRRPCRTYADTAGDDA